MSIDPGNGNGAGPAVLPGGTTLEDPTLGVNAMLRAIRVCAENAASDDSAQECKDYALAALSFAQAITTLDPSRLQGGDTPAARVAATPPPPVPVRDSNRNGKLGEK